MNRVCGFNCYSSAGYHFSYNKVTDSPLFKNFFNFSTFVSIGVESQGHYNHYFNYGNCQTTNTNFTNCKDPYVATIMYEYPAIASCKFSTAESCYCRDWDIIRFVESKTQSNINNCNFLKNNAPRSIIAAMHVSPMTVEDCVLLGNENGPLFMGYNVKITVIHCFIDDNKGYIATSYGPGAVDTQSASTTKFILNLDHLSTMNCQNRKNDLHPIRQVRLIEEGSIEIICQNRIVCKNRFEELLSVIQPSVYLLANET